MLNFSSDIWACWTALARTAADISWGFAGLAWRLMGSSPLGGKRAGRLPVEREDADGRE